MKKFIFCFIGLLMTSIVMQAVPAKRGWSNATLTDGSTTEIQLMGDEFYHYWTTRDGKIAKKQADGRFLVTNEAAPTPEQQLARRARSPRLQGQRRSRKDYGDLQIDRILVILVNFSDKAMQPQYNNAHYLNMLNAETNSVRDYFRQSSEGIYVPQFDVFGPYTLPRAMSYYGHNIVVEEEETDEHPDQMAVDACALAYDDGCDFSNYDRDHDGIVDNIYIIYAGYGENYNGVSEDAVWPHSWEISEKNVTGTLTYNGTTLGHYACSAELTGSSGTNADGLGTFCHEFSHVIGLPDYYDTNYKTNYKNGVTPGEWTLMDQGSYNGDGYYPALYSIYDKYFMGWKTPTLLNGSEDVTMPVGGDYARQITSDNQLAAVTDTNTVYYLENRQQEGYDTYLPGHGMVVWEVTYDDAGWYYNDLNNTAGVLRYTIVPADGKTKNYGQASDPFPGTAGVTSFTPIPGHALTDITEESKVISFKYNKGYNVQWFAQGTLFDETTAPAGYLTLPTATPDNCPNGKTFIGWTNVEIDESDEIPALAKTGNIINADTTYYAVFAAEDGEDVVQSEIYLDGDSVYPYYGTDEEDTSCGITCYYTNVMRSSTGLIQMKKNGSYIANKTALAKIDSIVIGSSTSVLTVYAGTSAKPASTTINRNGNKYDFSGGNYSYFTIKNENGSVAYLADITIYYSSSATTYSGYTTTCSGDIPAPVYYSIRFFSNGEQIGETQSVLKGQQAEKPEDPNAPCTDYTFAGWWTEELPADNTAAKSWISNFKATTDQDYYAVFSKTVDSGIAGTDYEKISTLDELTNGNYVVVGNDAYALKNSIYSNYYLATSSIHSSSNIIEDPAANIIWNITRSNDGVSFYNDAAKKYACLFETGTYHNLKLQDEANWFTPTVNNGNWSFESNDCAGWYLVYFVYNNTTREFAAKQSATTTIQLYKQRNTDITYYSSFINCTTTGLNGEWTNGRMDEGAKGEWHKVMENGQLYITKDGEKYTVLGTKVQ